MGNLIKTLCDEKTIHFKLPEEKIGSEREGSKNIKGEISMTQAQKNDDQMKISDFKQKRKLGEGSFGKVLLVEKISNGKIYALKKVKKERLLKNDIRIRDIYNEKEIMLRATHPFIVKLCFSFQDKNYLYYGMQYVSGGALISYLKKYRRLSESATKFYAAQVLLALEYLHENIKVIYRDLKPENVLVDENGYIKLADFGLSTIGIDTTKSMCGTWEYIAPEVLLANNYKKYIDFWGLGCLIYELTYGFPPFTSKDQRTLRNNIVKGIFHFPQNPHVSPEFKSIINGLLTVKVEDRLGFKGINEIKDHLWFKSINWDDILQKKIKAPIEINTYVNDNHPMKIAESLNDAPNIPIEGFTYKEEENETKF
jgi:serine/threonine protein kinase